MWISIEMAPLDPDPYPGHSSLSLTGPEVTVSESDEIWHTCWALYGDVITKILDLCDLPPRSYEVTKFLLGGQTFNLKNGHHFFVYYYFFKITILVNR